MMDKYKTGKRTVVKKTGEREQGLPWVYRLGGRNTHERGKSIWFTDERHSGTLNNHIATNKSVAKIYHNIDTL